MKHAACAGLLLALVAGTARAETLDIDLSARALQADFAGPLTDIFPRLNGLYDLGGIAGKQDGRYEEGHAGLLVTGDAGAEKANVTAGLGGRISLLDHRPAGGPFNGGALALGGQVEARLPAFNRIGVLGYAYGAPRASAFGDLTGYLEYAVDGDYQVLRNASVYAGYRELKINVKDHGSVTVDTGFHLGLRLNF
jgi:hypothetical protein